MALWHRVEHLTRGCGRWYSLLSGAAAAGPPSAYRSWRSAVASTESPPIGSGPSPFTCAFARSFAAPAQAKSKWRPAADASAGPRLNTAITAPFVRLVDEDGHGIVSLNDALDRAKKLNLDLVESLISNLRVQGVIGSLDVFPFAKSTPIVLNDLQTILEQIHLYPALVQRIANPPVCKIMDFHKERYKQEVKEKERAKSKSGVALRSANNKEVRFKAKTDIPVAMELKLFCYVCKKELKDLKIKADAVIRLMERGYRVKCTAMPTGKGEEDLGGLLSRLLALIEDTSIVESGPHVDSRQAYVIVRHVKFGLKKSGKKPSKVMEAVAKGVQCALPSAPVNQGSLLLAEEEWEPVDCSEAEDEALVNQVGQNEQELSLETTGKCSNLNKDWSKINATSKFEDVFDFDSSATNLDSNLSRQIEDLSFVGEKKISKYLHEKPSSESAVSGSTVPKFSIEMPKESSVIETNRYSKRTEIKGRFHDSNLTQRSSSVPYNKGATNQRRMPQEPIRSESQSYDQVYQRRLESAHMGKHNEPNFPLENNGIFSSRSSTSGDKKNLGSLGSGGPGTFGSQKPASPIFMNSANVPHGQQRKLGDETVDESRTGTEASRHGIFSSKRSAASSDEKNLNSAKVKSDSTSPPAARYGIFSSTKVASSTN